MHAFEVTFLRTFEKGNWEISHDIGGEKKNLQLAKMLSLCNWKVII